MRYGRGWAGMLLVGITSAALLVACSAPAPVVDNGPNSPNGSEPAPDGGVLTGSPDIGMGAPAPDPAPGPAGYDGGYGYSESAVMDRASAPAPMASYDYGYGYSYYTPPMNIPVAGIHTIGSGSVRVSPDLAILSMGVEARADEADRARAQAAEAMEAVLAELRALGVAEEDIETQHFSVYPQYTWREVVDRETGYRHGEQVLLGYQVTNNIQVKVRDLDNIGAVIDAVTGAAGDAIRIHHVSFTLDDPRAAEEQARELAVRDARAKAEQMAGWAGESLGKLLYLVETGMPSPLRMDMPVADARAEGGAPTTPILPRDLEVRATVQGVWDTE